MALIPLFGALALFWLSTRQWPLLVRLGIWAAGLAALIAAARLVLSEPDHFGLFRAFADLLAHWERPSEGVLVQAFDRNIQTVSGFVLQLLDVFIVGATLLGVVALCALTPGIKPNKHCGQQSLRFGVLPAELLPLLQLWPSALAAKFAHEAISANSPSTTFEMETPFG